MKPKLGDFNEYHAKLTENQLKGDVKTDRTEKVRLTSKDQVANYVIEQKGRSEEDIRKEVRDNNELPVTVRDINIEKLFLLNQVKLLPKTDGNRALLAFFTLKIMHDMPNWRIANLFKCPVDVIDLLEENGVKMVKEVIAKQPKVKL